MRVVPIPDDVALGEGQVRGTLGPPAGMASQDCDTIDVIWSEVELPSGQRVRTTQALVFVSADELERIKAAGGHFWFEVIGSTFPPVMFIAPGEAPATEEDRHGT